MTETSRERYTLSELLSAVRQYGAKCEVPRDAPVAMYHEPSEPIGMGYVAPTMELAVDAMERQIASFSRKINVLGAMLHDQ